ncbi:MAG: FHA domain-containing protein, partial [Dehalococcoidia bacterium]
MLQIKVKTGEFVRSQSVAGDAVALGRAPDNDVVLDEESVSRRHARIVRRGAALFLEDLGGTNGTRLNDRLLRRETAPFSPSDTIGIGPCQIRIAILDQPVANPVLPAIPPQPAPALVRAAPPPAVRPPRPTAAVAPTPPQAVRPVLHVRVPDGQYTVPIIGDEIHIGRGPDNDVIVDLPAVSIHHALVRRRGERWELVDQHSRNGTKLNDQPIESSLLAEGDVIGLAGAMSAVFDLLLPGVLAAAVGGRMPGTQALRGQPAPTAENAPVSLGPTPAPPRKAPARRFVPHALGAARITVGGAPANDLVLDSPQVSREHAVIERTGPTAPWVVTDLHTTNRTYVNNAAITQQPLSEGDVIRIGPYRLTVRQGEIEHFDETAGILLEAQSLVKVVGKGVRILQNVSLVIEPHEFVGIVGVSGAGKSTLLGAMSGLRPATSGAVLLNGFSLYEHFDSLRAQIGYVPQDDIIHKELTVERALDYAAKLRMPEDISSTERAARVNEVIDELGLSPQRQTQVANLSGGQRKRVSIGVEL